MGELNDFEKNPLPERSQIPEEGKASRRGLILRVVGTLASLGLLIYLIGTQGWDQFTGALKRLPMVYFWIGVGLILLSRISVTLRWYVLLRYANAKISFWQCFRLMFMGNFASNFLPSTVGGDLVRMAASVTLGVDAGASAASLVLDRLVGMAGMATFAPFGLYLISTVGGKVAVPGTHVGPGFSVLGLIALIQKLPGGRWAYQKLEQFTRGLITSSMGWLRRPKSLLLALLCTYGHMFSTFFIIWVLLFGLREPLSLLWIGALWSLSYFVSLAPVSINGLGLQEVSIILLYTRFAGISMQAATALALLIRLLFLLASLPGVLFLPEILRPLYGARASQKPAPTEPAAAAKP